MNNWVLCLTVFFIFGFSIGIFLFEKRGLFEDWANNYLLNFISARTGVKFFRIVLSSFLSSMLFLIVSFVCGTSVFGVVLSPFCVAFKGLLYGIISAMLYSEYSLKGVAFHAVVLLPPAIIAVIALVLSAKESMLFSLMLAKLTLPTAIPANLSYNFKKYCFKNFLFCLLILFSAVVDAVISTNFLSRFSL